jgi:DNA-binding CsgD family transcriptional regulator/tetratricopeptide (TPR) repeat protein
VLDPSGSPLIVLTGPAGAGRTRALGSLCRDLGAAGRTVHALRFTPDGILAPANLPTFADGSGSETGDTSGQLAVRALGPRAGAHDDLHLARRSATVAAALLRSDGDGVVVVDDAQWADLDALSALESLVPRLRDTAARCVVAVRTPGPGWIRAAGHAMFDRLRGNGLVTAIRLAPMRTQEIARAVQAAVDAVPARDLVQAIYSDSRGLPASVHDTVATLVASGAIGIVDHHAHLVRRDGISLDDHFLVASLRQLGPGAWTAAIAVAFLHPLGAALPRVLADALGATVERAEELLVALRAAGVLHRGRHGTSWRFLVPAVTVALRAAAGPFERQRLSAIAVDALVDVGVRGDDPTFLTDRIADARSLVPADLARSELTAQAARSMTTRPQDARRWWRAAAEVASDRRGWATARFMEGFACFIGGDYAEAARLLRELLDEAADLLDPERAQEASAILVTALRSTNDIDAMEAIAAGEDPTLQGGPSAPLCRAMALGLLDRRSEALRVADETRETWTAGPATRASGSLFEATAHLICGRPEFVDALLAAGGAEARAISVQYWHTHVNVLATVLLSVGELRRCDEMLAAEGLSESDLTFNNRATIRMLRGVESGDILDLARQAIANGMIRGYDAGRAEMSQTAANIMIGQGRLGSARELLATTRAEQSGMPFLLEDPDARIDAALGDADRAEERIHAALEMAAASDIVITKEIFLTQLGRFALARGDSAGAEEQLARLEKHASAIRTTQATGAAASMRALVHRDAESADVAIKIARDSGVPWGVAINQLQFVEFGIGDPADLVEAYTIFGTYGARLLRAWTRNAMAAHRVTVPGRQATVAENEQLLATLVAEGLSNRQIAATLRASEKSVEGRLSRLFVRSGYQSRIELAGAIRRGEFPD